MAVSVVVAVAFAAVAPLPDLTLRIVSVTLSPEAPGPGETVTVTTVVAGAHAPTVVLGYGVGFRGPQGRVVPMVANPGGGAYSAEFGPFFEGAEVWFFVAASTPNRGPVRSDFASFSVGSVPRDPSALRIVSVSHGDPAWSWGVSVDARVVNASALQDVVLVYAFVARQQVGGGVVVMDRWNLNGTVECVGSLPAGLTMDEPLTLFAYRVAARDVTNRTASSDVDGFEAQGAIPMP